MCVEKTIGTIILLRYHNMRVYYYYGVWYNNRLVHVMLFVINVMFTFLNVPLVLSSTACHVWTFRNGKPFQEITAHQSMGFR
jgi:hypothetical protein